MVRSEDAESYAAKWCPRNKVVLVLPDTLTVGGGGRVVTAQEGGVGMRCTTMHYWIQRYDV